MRNKRKMETVRIRKANATIKEGSDYWFGLYINTKK